MKGFASQIIVSGIKNVGRFEIARSIRYDKDIADNSLLFDKQPGKYPMTNYQTKDLFLMQ